jgi:hypothetical protein
MPTPLSGPGLGLPIAQNLYPTELQNAPYDFSTNEVVLYPGQQIPVPAGNWYINLGLYNVIQFLDPVTGVWRHGSGTSLHRGAFSVKSDGFNVRVANMTACPVSGIVTNVGVGGYKQGSTAITATGGTSTWAPIIDGNIVSISVTNAGAGYGVPPIVYIPAPPPAANNPNGVGGIPAVAWATIASGTVSTISLTNQGAGYAVAPVPVILPNPTDPNISTGITAATAVTILNTANGTLAGVLMTNPGAALAGINPGITLSVTGAGTQASASAIVMQTATKVSITTAGVGFGTLSAPIFSVGGVAPTGGIAANPASLGLSWLPRMLQAAATVAGASGSISLQNATIYDGGLFLSPPIAALAFGGTAAAGVGGVSISGPVIALTMGGQYDIVTMQPAP